MPALGLVLGLLCGLMHSVAYLASRHYLRAPGRTPLRLIILAHLWMLGFSLLLLPFLWHEPPGGWGSVVLPLAAVCGFYLTAQGFLFWTLRRVPASRLAPLLSFKIAFLALLETVLLQRPLSAQHWCAVALAVAGVLVLQWAGGRLSWPVLLGAAATCSGYAGADLCIAWLLSRLAAGEGASLAVPMFGTALCYVAAGGLALVALPFFPKPSRKDGRDALPFAASWFVAMLSLYAAFALLGVILSVILQASRGLWSILLASAIAGWGDSGLEQKAGWRIRLRQAGAASMLVGAVALWMTG